MADDDETTRRPGGSGSDTPLPLTKNPLYQELHPLLQYRRNPPLVENLGRKNHGSSHKSRNIEGLSCGNHIPHHTLSHNCTILFLAKHQKQLMNEDCLIAVALDLALKKRRKKRSQGSKTWYLKRNSLSHVNLMKDFRLKTMLFVELFTVLLMLLHPMTPIIQKQDTNIKEAITPHGRLSATLRFLVSGSTYQNHRFHNVISTPSLSKIIPETCKAIIEALKNYEMVSNAYKVHNKHIDSQKIVTNTLKQINGVIVPMEVIYAGEINLAFSGYSIHGLVVAAKLKNSLVEALASKNVPVMAVESKNVIDGYQFPNCLGAVDSKHVRIMLPTGSGSLYWNYKKFHNIVLMDIMDSNYEFIIFDLPPDENPKDSTTKLPYVIVGH
ncbi:hypothetical protein PR048_013892 [Dryococelus australis]|uniref:DDE Tnp4 domain-containing protein n=1 Tax=Dryococelus australis TaxID=614101 RepID=A0ABQ9HTG7_9NEOP|nr:hypothetical protein PR048_013892 [Dryococelus australis]